MKKIVLIMGVLLMTLTAKADPKSIGVKIGMDQMVSYQHGLGDGWLQIDAGGSGYRGVGANITYNWAHDYNGWVFYGGFGLGGGYDIYNQHEWCKKQWVDYTMEDGTTVSRHEMLHIPGFATFVGVVGSAGIQYEFSSVPIAVGIEYQPLFGLKIGRQNDHPGTKTPGNEKLKYGYHMRGLYDVNLTVRYLF